MAWGQTDPQAIVRQSISNTAQDWRASANWAWTQTDVATTPEKTVVTVSEIVPIAGTPYERVISKDGKKLSLEEQSRELRKYEKTVKQREAESPREREARMRKYNNERAFMAEIPDAYNFSLLGEDTIEGRAAWVLSMKPRPGFVPATPHGGMLEHIEGKLWIDKQDVQWIKAEGHAVDTVSIGWIVARLERGAQFNYEQQRVANGIWLAKRLTVEGLVRVMMVYGKSINEEVTCSGYHLEKQLQAGARP